MLVVGELVGSVYRIVRLIGQGGMGEVYEALHEPISRRVAIKTIRPELFGDPELVARFRREAEASAALGHPNIVQVTDFVMDPGVSPIMVMELLEGRTLRELVQSAQKLEVPRGVFIALQILSGLAAAHAAGIIHRDVKPANVFLQKTLAIRDHVKLLDFGVAKLAERSKAPVTERGIVLGTRAYMSPEQEQGGNVDARSDLYAVGATLYYALSGRKHRELNPEAQSPVPLRRMAAHVPAKLAAIVDRALAHDPAGRYASAEEMAEALSVFSKTTPGVGTATFLPGRGLEVAAAGAAAAAAAMRPRIDSTSTETSPPKTERDARFAKDVIDSDGSIKSASADALETTVDDPEARQMMTEVAHQAQEQEQDKDRDKDKVLLHTKRMAVVTRSEPPPPANRHGLMAATLPSAEDNSAQLPQQQNPHALLPPGASDHPSQIAVAPTPKRAPASRLTFVLLVLAFMVLLVGTLLGGRYFR